MGDECREKYNRNNVLIRAIDEIGFAGNVGAHLAVVPAWRCDESGRYQMDGILFGFYPRKDKPAEWTPPQAVIHDALYAPTLTWLPGSDQVGEPSPYRREGEPSQWQPFSSTLDDWGAAHARVVGCCLEIGMLFRRRSQNLPEQDTALLHRLSADYRVALPPELFAQCRALYPEFFDWLSEWAKK